MLDHQDSSDPLVLQGPQFQVLEPLPYTAGDWLELSWSHKDIWVPRSQGWLSGLVASALGIGEWVGGGTTLCHPALAKNVCVLWAAVGG